MEKLKKILILSAALLFLTQAVFAASPGYTAKPVEIVIVGTNDIHGAVFPAKAFWKNAEEPPLVGGFAALSYYINQIRKYNKNVLVLDAGDFFQGTPEGNISKGEVPLLLMNYINYDAIVLGNHEFDYGVKLMYNLSQYTRAPFLAANLEIKEDKIPKFYDDYIIKEFDGARVLILGLITSDLYTLTNQEVIEYFELEKEADAAKRILRELKGRYDICVALTHSGIDADSRLAAAVDGIDIIMGGHSHTGLQEPLIVNNTLIMQTYGKNTNAAVIKINYSPTEKKIISFDYELKELAYSDTTKDKSMELLIDYLTKEVAQVMDVEIGKTLTSLARLRGYNSSPLGSFIADVMREAVESGFAFQNKTGTRANMPAGGITLRTLYEIAPFGNTIIVMEMTGKEIKEALAHIYGDPYFICDFSKNIHITVDLSKDGIDRIKSVKINGKEIEDNKTYKAATNSFLASGGDRHDVLRDVKNKTDSYIVLRDALAEKIKKVKTLNYYFEPRLTVIE